MLPMLTELCQELRNWFDRKRIFGTIKISNGCIYADGREISELQYGMYFRIIGSFFNDGIHQNPSSDLHNETFDGAVWLLAIPTPIVELADEISAWHAKYGAANSEAMSPFESESYGGYSYAKASGSSSSGGSTSSAVSWKNAYRSRMNAWRKI